MVVSNTEVQELLGHRRQPPIKLLLNFISRLIDEIFGRNVEDMQANNSAARSLLMDNLHSRYPLPEDAPTNTLQRKNASKIQK
jgi:hypothetical protein